LLKKTTLVQQKKETKESRNEVIGKMRDTLQNFEMKTEMQKRESTMKQSETEISN
jgi:hypothetical protein